MALKGTFDGGCLCGELRYRGVDAIDAGYCHCRMCQRSSGAPVLAWITFAAERFAYEQGTPTVHRSSENGRREFCGSCGTQLLFRDTRTPDRVDVNMGSLDDPAACEPRSHTWTSSRIPWFETNDSLPRFEDGGPDLPGA